MKKRRQGHRSNQTCSVLANAPNRAVAAIQGVIRDNKSITKESVKALAKEVSLGCATSRLKRKSEEMSQVAPVKSHCGIAIRLLCKSNVEAPQISCKGRSKPLRGIAGQVSSCLAIS